MTQDTERRLVIGRYPVPARPAAVVVAALVAALLLGIVLWLVAGVSPWLPLVLVLLGYAAVRPMAGLVYAAVVLTTPLGLWAIGVQGLFGSAFGGRDYVLALSAVGMVLLHAVRVAVRWRPTRVQVIALGVAAALVAASALVALVHHGVAQTALGVRYLVYPAAALVAIAARPARDVTRLLTVMSWLLVANGVAATAEVAIGPSRLAAWGFDHGRAIRYIDGTFRAPGLTDFNAGLGMLAGAYLLGYVALWLTRGGRPAHRSWHAGAAAALVCLALSTSRSGAVLLAGGVLLAVALNRSGTEAARRRSRLLGVGILVLLAAAFAVVGATGADSLGQRFQVWGGLLGHHLPPWGLGVGAVGAASNSRTATGPPVFVDNYYVSLALQFGPVLAVAAVAAIVALLAWLSRRSAADPAGVLYLAVVAGLCASFLVIEGWEYDGAMLCLAVFTAYGIRVLTAGRATAPEA